MSQQFTKDMCNHFSHQLLTLIGDTGDTCDAGDMESSDIVKLLLSGLLLEATKIAVVMKIDEDSFVAMCRGIHQEARRLQLRQKQREA